MKTISASAPGKAIVSGEYAVLDGAPAVSMALNRRARAVIAPIDADCHTLTAPGFQPGSWRFRADEETIDWLDAPPHAHAFRLLECVWRCVAPTPPVSCAVTLDTREFHDPDSGRKLGLGSSAALAVATAAALSELGGRDRAVAELADAAHRAFQDGRGSGVDVATAVHGGLVRFTRGGQGAPGIWPDSLDVRILWSGVVADTGQRIASRGRGSAGSAEALARAARDVDDAFRRGAADSVPGVLRDYVDALSAFDLDHELGIFEAGHRQLADHAKSTAEVVYKPCGAGGGDIGMAISASVSALNEFIEYAEQTGFSTIDALLDNQGVCVEVT